MRVYSSQRDDVPSCDRALRDAISRIVARGLDHCRRSYIVSLEDAPDDEHEEGIWQGYGAQTPDHWPSWTELCTVDAVEAEKTPKIKVLLDTGLVRPASSLGFENRTLHEGGKTHGS